MTAPKEFAGRYMTEAVESTVRDRDREVVGHVGLLDVDDVERETPQRRRHGECGESRRERWLSRGGDDWQEQERRDGTGQVVRRGDRDQAAGEVR